MNMNKKYLQNYLPKLKLLCIFLLTSLGSFAQVNNSDILDKLWKANWITLPGIEENE